MVHDFHGKPTQWPVAGLGLLGGEAKRDFVLELMRTTRDKNLRQTALRACIRMEANNEEMHSGLAGFLRLPYGCVHGRIG